VVAGILTLQQETHPCSSNHDGMMHHLIINHRPPLVYFALLFNP
jgi:hypothetical protein